MTATFLRSELHPLEQHLSWFEQDGATAHTAQISMQVLRTVFPGRLFSRFGNIAWPARSPDLAVPDYLLWGYVESKVYKTHSANIDYIKQRILECIQGIRKEMLQRIMADFPRDYSKVLNDLVVTYKVAYSNLMIKVNSHGYGMHPTVLIKFFPVLP
jgi:hypothetical protein